MAYVIETIGNVDLFGEAPHWDDETQSLYLANVVKNEIQKYTPSLQQHTFITVGKLFSDKTPSLIIPVNGSSNRYVITQDREIAILTWDGVSPTPTSIETIAVVDNGPGLQNNRFNDGKADHLGNLWAGTMSIYGGVPLIGPKTGSLYSMDFTIGDLKIHRTNIGVSNGIAWSNDMKKMYYIDSTTRVIDRYDFDASNRSISNRQPWFNFNNHPIAGLPDGQTIDTDGNIWVVLYLGGVVVKISTSESDKVLDIIPLPDLLVTSVAFGGSDFDVLFVTGAFLHKITGLGVRGMPANRVRI
ncbi:hypothetical protein RI129_001306 [Pyrocoelia pectoralis]|uniref:SMP-30/Gluconolactonase/LRE-like region domain-containing protein n=1 Tax=Pyrocoelia pectoralis TaxID=417401 RepID=A0AAN7VKI4_9COLE